MWPSSYFNSQLEKTIQLDNDPVLRARLSILTNILWITMLVSAAVAVINYNQPNILLFIRPAACFVLFGIVLWLLVYMGKWRASAHLLLLTLSALCSTHIFIYEQSISIITLQFILIILLGSFYLLGKDWGIIYSLLSIAQIIGYFILHSLASIHFVLQPKEMNSPTFIIVLLFNLLVLVYIHYNFFKSFDSVVKKLSQIRQDESLLNERLQETIRLAEKSSQAKTQFLSTMSHELRTPLNAVIGMSNVLLSENPRADQAENLNVLRFSAQNLLTVINDVLDFNKIDSGNLQLEQIPFNLYKLVQNVYAGFRTKTNEKKLNFELNCHPKIQGLYLVGDPTRLTQILFNLLSNAVKFTAQGSILFKVDLAEKTVSKASIIFTITDTGIGIHPDQHEKIFQPFSQAYQNITRKYGGTGLGLAIVRHLLDLHNSPIELISQPQQGSTFRFKIDYKLAEQPKHEESEITIETEKPDLSALKVLIAEDNDINILFMRKLLKTWQLTPVFAHNGLEALNAVKEDDFDLLLMDIHMPVMDGYEATRLIRQIPDKRKSGIPIIALTASVIIDANTRLFSMGIDDYVIKPFDPKVLLDKLTVIKNNKLKIKHLLKLKSS
ncbi:response regulator [Pedobacter sp. BS3]|uniref:ATP-binding protein n=1 Tax=Pedobacter sp. BS3 TaxID=2567937 RepID=UPI0011ECC278|nr:ATP-binding protein [Pedobacter sp. BS3]TZF84109.1 response regulator [Pedobacter sp. BS3]